MTDDSDNSKQGRPKFEFTPSTLTFAELKAPILLQARLCLLCMLSNEKQKIKKNKQTEVGQSEGSESRRAR
jgi:hypothetical protein